MIFFEAVIGKMVVCVFLYCRKYISKKPIKYDFLKNLNIINYGLLNNGSFEVLRHLY